MNTICNVYATFIQSAVPIQCMKILSVGNLDSSTLKYLISTEYLPQMYWSTIA